MSDTDRDRIIPLTSGYWLVVDVDDHDLLARHRWRTIEVPSGNVSAARTGKTGLVSVHSVIADRFAIRHPGCR
jgi:hypothetical protein